MSLANRRKVTPRPRTWFQRSWAMFLFKRSFLAVLVALMVAAMPVLLKL